MHNLAAATEVEPREAAPPVTLPTPVPSPRPSPLTRARTLCQLRRFAEAVPAAATAIDANPRDVDAWCVMAEAQLGSDRPEAALRAAETAAALSGAGELPHRLASLALERLERPAEAVEAAQRATVCAPESWAAHARLAEGLCAVGGRGTEAQAAAERAIALSPELPGPYLALGTVALAAGRRAEASTAYCRAMAVDPQCLEAHHRLTALPEPRRRRGLSALWGPKSGREPEWEG